MYPDIKKVVVIENSSSVNKIFNNEAVLAFVAFSSAENAIIVAFRGS